MNFIRRDQQNGFEIYFALGIRIFKNQHGLLSGAFINEKSGTVLNKLACAFTALNSEMIARDFSWKLCWRHGISRECFYPCQMKSEAYWVIASNFSKLSDESKCRIIQFSISLPSKSLSNYNSPSKRGLHCSIWVIVRRFICLLNVDAFQRERSQINLIFSTLCHVWHNLKRWIIHSIYLCCSAWQRNKRVRVLIDHKMDCEFA